MTVLRDLGYVRSYVSSGDNRKIEFGGLRVDVIIPFGETPLLKALYRCHAGDWSSSELSQWATFVLGCQAFVPVGETEEELWEAGEGPVWDLLQRLSAPSIFADLSPETIQHYIEMISGRSE